MWRAFHHPDISLPVVRRRVGLDLLETLDFLGEIAIHGMYGVLRNNTCPNLRSYNRALNRLSSAGLLIKHQGLKTPILSLSEQGIEVLEAFLRPDKWWNRRWNGIWYLLVYDVPEADRRYRNVLRQFLKQQRFGCFQKSVWITPHDVRPQYSDLDEAAALGEFACLFETRTVLGMRSEKVVWDSWDFDELYKIQNRFCNVYSENLDILSGETSWDQEALMQLACQQMDAFRSAFVLDPLLPDELLPRDYKGKQVYALHRTLAELLRVKLVESNPD